MSTLFGKKSKRRKTTTIDNAVTKVTAVDEDNTIEKSQNNNTKSNGSTLSKNITTTNNNALLTFSDLGLCPPLLRTCKSLGFKRPTPVQRAIIPTLLSSSSNTHILALSATGSGKTAAFVLPILHTLSYDPYGIYAVILTPTRELAKQIQEQVLALGSSLKVKSTLVVGGLDQVKQSCEIDSKRPHFIVATPGRLAELLRGPNPPILKNVRYMVLDEADRLLKPKSGFQRDVAEVLLHGTTTLRNKRREKCQTLLFSATMTRSLESLEEMAGAGCGRLPLTKFVIRDDGEVKVAAAGGGGKKKKRKQSEDDGGTSPTSEDEDNSENENKDEDDETDEEEENKLAIPKIPSGLRQEYVFMPSRVRDAYLITVIRNLMVNGGRRGSASSSSNDRNGKKKKGKKNPNYQGSGWNSIQDNDDEDDDDNNEEGSKMKKARSAIIFVSTCERSAHVSGILTELGVDNVSLHSLLSQNRRLAALGKFKSQQVRVLVATDVASRGLDVPTVDLVVNAQLPRRAVDYIHRVGRTARAGRRGRAVSLVCETDVSLVHAAEEMSGRKMDKCADITDDDAVKLLGSVTKASRLTKMKLMDIGFDDLVKRQKERKARDRRERMKAERAANRIMKQMAKKKKDVV